MSCYHLHGLSSYFLPLKLLDANEKIFSMITMSAFIGKAPYHDFVSVMFLPLLPILGIGLILVNKVILWI